jgi:hypothetical protein
MVGDFFSLTTHARLEKSQLQLIYNTNRDAMQQSMGWPRMNLIPRRLTDRIIRIGGEQWKDDLRKIFYWSIGLHNYKHVPEALLSMIPNPSRNWESWVVLTTSTSMETFTTWQAHSLYLLAPTTPARFVARKTINQEICAGHEQKDT